MRQVAQVFVRRSPYLYHRYGYGRTQQPENQRNGGRSGQPESVEDIQQDHVGEHDGQKDHHHLVEIEIFRIKNSPACHFHHTAGKNGAEENTCRCDEKNDVPRCGFGTEGGVEKIDGVVRYPYDQGRDGERHKYHQDNQVNIVHKIMVKIFGMGRIHAKC